MSAGKIVWRYESYQSGTHVVISDKPGWPHYYVYADSRSEVCQDLRDWLNGGERPVWASTLKLHEKSKECCVGKYGIEISAVGPMVLPQGDNGRLGWQTDETKSAERQMLINNLMKCVK